MKKNILLLFVLALFGLASQSFAQQSLAEYVRSLDRGAGSSATTHSTSNCKRVAFLFSQTHLFDDNKNEYVEDKNIAFRVGNYIQIKSALERFGKFDQIGSCVGLDLNKDNVNSVFQFLAEETNPGDEIFIYWESHGFTHNNTTYLCLSNTPRETVNLNTLISDKEFSDMLLLLKDRRVMLLMEACNSGGLLAAEAQASRNSSKNVRFLNTNDPESFAEKLDQLCGNYDYSSLEPLLNDFLTTSKSATASNSSQDWKRRRSPFFRNAFMGGAKDITATHPNLSVIFSSGETESSWCPLVNTNNKMLLYNQEVDRWFTIKLTDFHPNEFSSDEKIFPFGAPTFALIVALSDKTGKYSSGNHTDFEDVWKIAKNLIPENCKRIASASPDSSSNSQRPEYLNNNGQIDVRPAN